MKKKVNSRAKGIRGELEACKVLEKHGFTARRAQQYKGTADSSDIEVPRFDRLHLFPEVKRVEALRLSAWMKQCRIDIDTHAFEETERTGKVVTTVNLNNIVDDKPVIIHKRSKEPWLITMDFEDFLELVNELEGGH